MKEKDRRGVPLREWLDRELQDPEFKRHYEEASIKWRVAMQIVGARHKANLTQGELARQIGDKQQNVSRIERGEQNVTIGTLDKIAKAVGGRLTVRIESKARSVYRSHKMGILRVRDRKRQFKARGRLTDRVLSAVRQHC
jgi:transcriptional regulator with XRE-family HTH domain